ncbi:MAG: PKD domain-containing protein [Bacteroidia bacterium]
MKKLLQIVSMFIFLTGMCRAQNYIPMGLPAQSSTFGTNVRGYWFQSPSCFTITGLEVPTDASTGTQNIAVIRFDDAPPAYPDTAPLYTVLYLTQNDTASGMIPVNIEVNVGEYIGILGNRADLNSYGTSPFTTAIGSFPVTISRLGMQYPLSSTAPKEMWTETGGSVSRVIMYYDTVTTINLTYNWQGGFNYSFTNGASPTSLSIYDYGDGSPLDTTYNPTHTFPTWGTYTICSYVTGNCVSDTSCTTITICPTPALASFSYLLSYPNVAFTDQSQNAVAWSWDFGDGNTSTQQSPTHNYGAQGLYHVCLTVTDSCGGQHTKCRNVSFCPSMITVNAGNDVTACGTANLTLPGYITYEWSTGDTTMNTSVSATGDYSVIVTDLSGCSGTDTIHVDILPLPNANLGPDTAICGGVLQIGVPPVAGNTYLWSIGATSTYITIGTGAFTLTVTDPLGCVNVDVINVVVHQVPVVSYFESQTSTCLYGGAVTLTAGTPAGGVYSGPGVTGNSFDPLAVGLGSSTIQYTYTAPTGCSASDTSSIMVDICSGVQEFSGTNVQVYPNPGSGLFTVKMQVRPDLVYVTDIAGREVYRYVPSEKNFTIDLSTHPAGSYTLGLKQGGAEKTMPLMIVK